jgi:hypothetical protein
MWKEVVVAENYPVMFLKELGKTTRDLIQVSQSHITTDN